MQNGLTSGTADKLKHGQVLTFLTFHNVKQVLADGGCAGLGFGLRLGLRSIFVFVLVVVVVLLVGPQKRCRHMLLGSCFCVFLKIIEICSDSNVIKIFRHLCVVFFAHVQHCTLETLQHEQNGRCFCA